MSNSTAPRIAARRSLAWTTMTPLVVLLLLAAAAATTSLDVLSDSLKARAIVGPRDDKDELLRALVGQNKTGSENLIELIGNALNQQQRHFNDVRTSNPYYGECSYFPFFFFLFFITQSHGWVDCFSSGWIDAGKGVRKLYCSMVWRRWRRQRFSWMLHAVICYYDRMAISRW